MTLFRRLTLMSCPSGLGAECQTSTRERVLNLPGSVGLADLRRGGSNFTACLGNLENPSLPVTFEFSVGLLAPVPAYLFRTSKQTRSPRLLRQ